MYSTEVDTDCLACGEDWCYSNNCDPFSTIKDKIFTKIEVIKDNEPGKAISDYGDIIIFHQDNGDRFILGHQQDCCEAVYIEDIDNDLDVLVGEPIVFAYTETEEQELDTYDHQTYSFFRAGTIKGSLCIRWYGSSNGYYSEKAEFKKLRGDSNE